MLGVAAVNVITPNELSRELFQWVHDEEVVDALYLQVGGWGSFGMWAFCCSG